MQYCNVHLKIAAPNSPSTGSMNGDIVFTPDNERGSVWSEGDTITPSSPVRCELVNGVLMYNGNSKVQLMAGGHTVNPEKVYWRVAFENITLGEEPVQIDPFVFEAIPGETIDLARVTPVMGYTPPGVIRGAAGLKFLGVVNSASDLPSVSNQGDAYVNIANKSIFIWNGSKWEEIEDFASVDGNVETFSTVLARAIDAAERAEFSAEEIIQQVEGDFATRNYVDGNVQPLEDDLSSAVTYINGLGGDAGRLLRLGQNGNINVLTSSITENTNVANRYYVDSVWTRFPRATGDLNDIHTPGVYKLAVREVATLENNYPEVGITGILEVYAVGDGSVYPFQRITTRSDTPRIYIRRSSGSSVTGWMRWNTFVSDADSSLEEFTTLDPDGYYAPAGQKLTLPTHDGSGQATHPSVLHFPDGFNGYRYWMAVTPFPNGNDDYEDPDILASQDGTTWVVPDGLTNPLDDAPGNPQYNSDTCLSVGPDNTMWCFWRFYDKLNGSEVIYGRSTTDGVTWTPREEIIRNDDADGNINRLLSPSLVYDPRNGGSWRMWVINRSDYTDGDWVKLKHTVGPKNTWNFTGWQNVTVAPLQDRYRPWHMSVRSVEGKYVGILCASDSLFQATYDNLMLVGDSSTNFRVSSMPSVERTSTQHTSLYQSSMVPVPTTSGVEWDVFYSGIYAPTNTWNVFRTRMRRRTLGSLRGFIEEKLTPPDSGWRDVSDTLNEGWTGQVRIRRIGWEIFVELTNVTRESGSNHRMISLPRFGFLPSFNIRRDVLTTSQKPIELRPYTWVGDLGSMHVAGYAAGDVLHGGFSFLTSDRPPSEWPGVPA